MGRKPFFLNVAFYATHAVLADSEQYEPQPWSKMLYDDVTIPEPVTNTRKDWEDMPLFFQNSPNQNTANDTVYWLLENADRYFWHKRFYNPAIFQLMMKRTYRMVTEVDYTAGVILDELKRQGIYDNTFIIFTGDNGVFHAEHGLSEKYTPHEESLRTPLIINDPRMPDHMKGTMNHDYTLNIDLAPTILDAAGLSRPEEYMGRNMADLYLDENVTWREDFYYEFLTDYVHPKFMPMSEALVNKEYKYFFWPQYKYEQLFHLTLDKYERIDVLHSDVPNKTEIHKVHMEMKRRFEELKSIVNSREPVML